MKKIYTASVLLATWLYPVMAMAEYADPADASDGSAIILGLLFFAMGIALYFLPAILASKNKQCNNADAIFWLNLFLGWTFLGWVVALIMAIWKKEAESKE